MARSWQAMVSKGTGTLAQLAGGGVPPAELKIPLPTDNLPALAAGGDLAVKLKLLGRKGQSLDVAAAPVRLKVVQTRASLAVDPSSVTIEEIKTIDASPMLGHVYFAPGSSEIDGRYVRFSGPADTAGFDEQKFRDTLEKYYQLLNIVGKRLADTPSAKVTLVDSRTGKVVLRDREVRAALSAYTETGFLRTEEQTLPLLSRELAKQIKDTVVSVW